MQIYLFTALYTIEIGPIKMAQQWLLDIECPDVSLSGGVSSSISEHYTTSSTLSRLTHFPLLMHMWILQDFERDAGNDV